jgi:hypothetical protein
MFRGPRGLAWHRPNNPLQPTGAAITVSGGRRLSPRPRRLSFAIRLPEFTQRLSDHQDKAQNSEVVMYWSTGDLRNWLIATAGLGVVVFLLGCSSGSAVPLLNSIGGSRQGMSYWYFEDKGLKILLVDDVFAGRRQQQAGGTTSKPVWSGSLSADGSGYTWQIEWIDGKSAKVRIDGIEYDSSQGAVFVIKTKGDKLKVRQMNRDLSVVPFTHQGCWEFLNKDVEILKELGAAALSK